MHNYLYKSLFRGSLRFELEVAKFIIRNVFVHALHHKINRNKNDIAVIRVTNFQSNIAYPAIGDQLFKH